MTKISLPAIKLNLSEKAQTFLTTFFFKKLVMLLCFLGFLAVVVIVLLSAQFAAKQNLSEDLQSRSDLNGILVGNGSDKADEDIGVGRKLMLEVEELANIELARILELHFGSDNNVEGRVHYDLLDVEDYFSPLLTNWTKTDGVSALIQSENFLVESNITLRFADDTQVDNFELDEVQQLFDNICQVDIVKAGQKASILLKSSESARLFFCPQINKGKFELEEIAIN